MQASYRFYQVLLSLISPVLGIIVAAKSRNKGFIIFGGTVFMGFIGSVFFYVEGNDGHTHLMRAYELYMNMSLEQFLDASRKLLTFQSTPYSNDLYIHLISYVSAGVFQTPELMHVFGGLLLGFFFTKSVLLVLEDKNPEETGILLTGFIFFFLLSNSISALNTLRMWPAMWVFFYGAFSFIKRRKFKYLAVVFLAVFIHFSYLLYSVPLIFAILLRNRRLIVVAAFIGSFFISLNFEQSSSLFQEIGLYEGKVNSNVRDAELKEQLDEENAEKLATNNFYKKLGPELFRDFSVVLLAFILVVVYLSNVRIGYFDFLIASGLLIMALANLSKESSSAIFGRGYNIASTFLLAATIIVLSKKQLFLKPGFKTVSINISLFVFLFSCIPYVLFQFSYILNTVSVFIFFIPTVSWVMGDGDMSIRDFLIYLF